MLKSRVIILKSSRVNGEPSYGDISHLTDMLGEGLTILMNENDIQNALNRLIPAGKKIGIKPNCVAGRMMSSSPVLCSAIIKLLENAGNVPADITIWERSERELRQAGYDINLSGNKPKVVGNDSKSIGYSRNFSTFGEVGSLVTRVLTDIVDYHINFPVLKDHSLAGLCGGFKNFYGAVHNPNKYHDNNCNPYAADIYSLPEIKNKNRLTIMDCFKIQYNAGPGYRKKYAVGSNIVIMSDDPVAVDSAALDMLENLRRENGLKDLKSVGRYPLYLKTAADEKHRLGNFNRDLIEKVEIKI